MSLLVVGPTNSAMAMRVALRLFLLDREGALYRLPSATLDRMLQIPTRHRLPRLVCQRVRSAEVAVEMMNGRPLRVVRSVFNMLTFKSDGTLVPPLRDRHVRARAELALALGHRPATQGLPKPVLGLLLEAVNGLRQRLSCDGSSKSPWGARNAPEYHPPDPDSNDRSSRSLGVVQNHNRPLLAVHHVEMIPVKPTFAAYSTIDTV